MLHANGLTQFVFYAIIILGKAVKDEKIISRILFLLTIVTFMFGIYVAVFGATDVISKWEELEATGNGGMEYMAVGTDMLAVGVVLIPVIGAITAIISAKIARCI